MNAIKAGTILIEGGASFLGMPDVSVSAHSRHIQKSSAFLGYQQQESRRKL